MRSTRVRIFVSAILMAFIGVGVVVADEENKETVLPLLAFVSMGCSMSTVVNMIANRLLAAHGYRMMPDYEKTGDKEVINLNCLGTAQNMPVEVLKKKNMFFRPEDEGTGIDRIISAMKRYVRFKDSNRSNIVVKFDSICLTDPAQKPLRVYLRSIFGLKTVALYRRNVLDLATCFVRDFYGKCSRHNGYVKRLSPGHDSVNATSGHSSDVCFRRRSYHGNEKFATKAKFNIETLEPLLNFFGASKDGLLHIANGLKSWTRKEGQGRPSQAVAAEDLMAFEYHPNYGNAPHTTITSNIDISIGAWTTVLREFGVAKPNKTTIRDVLCDSDPASKTLFPHSHSIFNVDEVEIELKRIGNLTYFRPETNV